MAAAVGKRKLDEVAESAVAVFDANKKAREGSPGAGKDVALAVTQIKTGGALLPAGIKRTSGLEAPTMLLTGHSVCREFFMLRQCHCLLLRLFRAHLSGEHRHMLPCENTGRGVHRQI
jgi:hypothetical protein